MKTISDEQLAQSGTAVRAAFEDSASPDPTSINRLHRLQRIRSTAVFTIVLLLAGLALFSSIPDRSASTTSASQAEGDLPVYGLTLGDPWIFGEINHNAGAYDVDYWETYYYLVTNDGRSSSVVVRITTRRSDDEDAVRSVPALNARDAGETNVAGRDVGLIVNAGVYSFGWIDGNALVDVVVIPMEKGAVTSDLADHVLSNVHILTEAERSEFSDNQTIVPSGPETSVPN